MLKYIDVKCDNCDETKEALIETKEDIPECDKCGSNMHRIFTSMNFRLKYNNKTDMCSWGDHGYASSQYWTQVKNERQKGNDVKPIDQE